MIWSMVKGDAGSTAVLTGFIVSYQDIPFAERHSYPARNPYIPFELYHGRALEPAAERVNHDTVAFDLFRASVNNHDNRPLCNAEMQRFVGVVQDQNFQFFQHPV